MDKTRSIADNVYTYIEDAILSGEFSSGEILSELRLCKILNVSRTPVREAITRLNQEGLIENSPKGSVVVGIDENDICDIYEIRLRIEGLVLEKCIDRISDERIAILRETVELQEFYTFKNKFDQLKEIDGKFHDLIYSFSDSKILENLLRGFHRKVARYRKNSFETESRAEDAVREHRMILDAIIERNKQLAVELSLKHIENARDNILKSIKNRG